jgi:hypothetical protein
MSQRVPPAYVPTLTEVVQPSPAPAASLDVQVFDEEELVARVLRRVEQGLEDRLREAVAAVVLAHTRDLVPALQAEIDAVVRRSVADALGQELGSTPAR